VKNQRFLPVLNFSSNNFLDSFCAATFLVASSKTSGVTTPFKSTSNEYRVGMRWFKLMYLMKVLHLDRLSCFFWSIFLVIFLGTVLKPHTKACPYGRAFVPSSLHLTITAFLPAYRPLVTTTTLPPARVKKEEEKIHLVSLLSNVKEDFPVERRMEKRNVQREGGREQAANRGGNVDSFGRKYRTRANDESSTNTRNLVKNAFEPVF